MRYLKSYKDNNELIDFLQDNLAYLIDEGFEIEYGRIDPLAVHLDKYTQITISKGSRRASFNWKSIQDHFIPFIKRLSDIYDIKKFNGYGTVGEVGLTANSPWVGVKWSVYTLKEIIEEESSSGFPMSVSMVRIKVGDKK